MSSIIPVGQRIQLPVAKIKRIAKVDPDVHMISAEGAAALTLATQMFAQYLASQVCETAHGCNRRTLRMCDLEMCVRDSDCFQFLDGTLEEQFPTARELLSDEDEDKSWEEFLTMEDVLEVDEIEIVDDTPKELIDIHMQDIIESIASHSLVNDENEAVEKLDKIDDVIETETLPVDQTVAQ